MLNTTNLFPLLFQGLVQEDSTFVLGVEGILTEEEVYQTLKVKQAFLNSMIVQTFEICSC